MLNNEYIIFLHGLARSRLTWCRMSNVLKQQGFQVVNLTYPSRHARIEVLAMETINKALDHCRQHNAHKIHFITHSMGGILIRYYLTQRTVKELGHVVMLSPPNHGSELVDKLGNLPGFRQLNGPAGYQLSARPDSLPNTLGPADYSVGIMTGNRSINLLLSTLIPGPDDGKVSVESAKLEGMHDFRVVPSTHPFIMQNNSVIREVTNFLRTGHFTDLTLF